MEESVAGSAALLSLLPTVVAGGDKDWGRGEGTLELLEGCLTFWGPQKSSTLLGQVVQRARNAREVTDKGAVVTR